PAARPTPGPPELGRARRPRRLPWGAGVLPRHQLRRLDERARGAGGPLRTDVRRADEVLRLRATVLWLHAGRRPRLFCGAVRRPRLAGPYRRAARGGNGAGGYGVIPRWVQSPPTAVGGLF